MPSLLTASQIDIAVNQVINHFDTFSREIVVYKESIKTQSSDTNTVFGYGDGQDNFTFTHEEVKATYFAFVMYKKSVKTNRMTEIELSHPEAEVLIKVREDGHQYIKNGNTERITFDGLSWAIVAGPRKKMFLSLPFYYYEVKRIA